MSVEDGPAAPADRPRRNLLVLRDGQITKDTTDVSQGAQAIQP